MINVCDAIMGSGKTQSAITYINEHPEERFIYITPYLKEATRIKESCPKVGFVEPSEKIKKYHFRKSEHTAALIREGKNITTTHRAFRGYTFEMLDDIRSSNYTLIIDENVDMLEKIDLHPDDIRVALESGLISEEDGKYQRTDKSYSGEAYADIFYLMQTRNLIKLEDGDTTLFYWVLPPELIEAFDKVFILTYLFEGQGMCNFLKMYDLPYRFIGIDHSNGEYRFVDHPMYIPEYVSRLPEMIHILDDDRMNDIGKDRGALSMTWFEGRGDTKRLANNVYNYFNNINRHIPASHRLWGTYKSAYSKIRGKGYYRSYISFNERATNAYRDKDCLAYVCNVYMNVGEKRLYKKRGIDVDEDQYALSTMVQWIWRSAIRDGKEIYIYIPSKRMRTLLVDWINKVKDIGGGANVEM